jgi:hypothetical protein
MNDESHSNQQNPLHELEGAVGQAVADLRLSAPPVESLDRLVVRASQLPESQPIPGRRWRVYTAACAVAIATIVMLSVFLSAPPSSWALVMQAVQSKPWIHGTMTDVDGSRAENWLSLSRDVSARQSGKWALFDDIRAKTRQEYRPDEGPNGTLYREPMPLLGEFQQIKDMFVGAMRGDKLIAPASAWGEVVSQELRTVNEDQKRWTDYDFVLRHLSREETIRFVFRVDPATNLPAFIKISGLSDGPTQPIEIAFDYPDENAGPRDIYDLGVPRNAKLVDRMPSQHLADVIAAINRSQEQFGPYFAIVAHTAGASPPWEAIGVDLVWRKGTKIRIESALIRAEDAPKQPAEGTDMIGWWKDRLSLPHTMYTPSLACDGKTVWKAERPLGPVGENPKWKWKAISSVSSDATNPWLHRISIETLPDVISFGFPPVASSDQEVRLVEIPKDGPPGCILAERRFTREPSSAYHLAQYWYDPSHSYLMRKYKMSDLRAENEAASSDSYVSESIARSPKGVWYSSCIRHTVVQDEEPSVSKTYDSVFWYFVDFNAKLPDSLFKPEVRTGEIK